MGKVKIVEEQIAREVRPGYFSFTYGERDYCASDGMAASCSCYACHVHLVITNEDNPFGVLGYEATVTVVEMSENPASCFVTWSASWHTAKPAIDGLSGLIRGSIASAEKKLAGKSRL
jgi:hypothetical protein